MNDYKCPPGYYCPAGTVNNNDYPCPPGTYNPSYGAKTSSECIPAPPGFYIPSAGAGLGQSSLDSAHLCTAGYYCMLGSYTPTPTGSVTTIDGHTMLYQNIGGECSSGFYCPAGTPIEIPCTPGYICEGTMQTAATVLCDAGYYCEQGSNDAAKLPCPPGYYCIEGSAEPIPCPAGRYSNS